MCFGQIINFLNQSHSTEAGKLLLKFDIFSLFYTTIVTKSQSVKEFQWLFSEQRYSIKLPFCKFYYEIMIPSTGHSLGNLGRWKKAFHGPTGSVTEHFPVTTFMVKIRFGITFLVRPHRFQPPEHYMAAFLKVRLCNRKTKLVSPQNLKISRTIPTSQQLKPKYSKMPGLGTQKGCLSSVNTRISLCEKERTNRCIGLNLTQFCSFIFFECF